jgi:hypothetical protein
VSLTEAVEQALAGLRESFVADGYDLRVDGLDGDRVKLSILAGPEACEECLVPKPQMEGIILQSLKDFPDVRQLELHYPTDPGVTDS